jgi:hypothetical protein
VNVFLIDADNLNSGAWIDEAFRVLEASEGPLSVRRAYGSADNLKNLADVLRAWAVRPFMNLALTKNTTDIALAVDAMELACQNPPPQLVVIGSGDADFLPLVVRLRERGIRMVCVSERSKMGREAVSAYDRVILVGPAQEPLASTDSSIAKPVRKPAKAKAPAKKVVAKTATPKPAAAKKTPARKAKPSAPVVAPTDSAAFAQALPDVAAILQAIPNLQDGQPHPLAAVAKALLDAKLRGKNTTATKLLKKFPLHFALLPLEKPRTVTYHSPQEPA